MSTVHDLKNALQLTYSNVEFQKKILGETPPEPTSRAGEETSRRGAGGKGEGDGTRKGQGEGKEGKENRDPAPKY